MMTQLGWPLQAEVAAFNFSHSAIGMMKDQSLDGIGFEIVAESGERAVRLGDNSHARAPRHDADERMSDVLLWVPLNLRADQLIDPVAGWNRVERFPRPTVGRIRAVARHVRRVVVVAFLRFLSLEQLPVLNLNVRAIQLHCWNAFTLPNPETFRLPLVRDWMALLRFIPYKHGWNLLHSEILA